MRPKVNLVVLDPGSGRARPGAWVTFYHSNTLDKPTLYADDDVATVMNPVQANGLGQVAVRVESGTYDVSMTFDGALPTVVEDVLAWTPEADVITSPGDLLVGGPGGENQRLAVGSTGQVLLVENGMPTWRTLAGGVGLPTGTPGSLVSYGPANALTSILPGLQDQTLVMAGGIPTWSSILAPGTTLPINQPGDLVVGAVTTGLPSRLARGATGDVLTVASTGGLAWTASVTGVLARGIGQCRLELLEDIGQLQLRPDHGSSLWIDGQLRVIPDGGVFLAPTGFTPYTVTYIYAAWIAGAIVLEGSTVNPVQTGGLYHKTGDQTRTLVGLVVCSPGPAFVDTDRNRWVISYFNNHPVSVTGFFTAPRSVTSSTLVEIHSEIQCSFLAFGEAEHQFATVITASGVVNCPEGNVNILSVLSLNAVAQFGVQLTQRTPDLWTNIACSRAVTLPTNVYILSLMGARTVLSGNPVVTWGWDASGLVPTRISALITG
jgi:hypothetical protein